MQPAQPTDWHPGRILEASGSYWLGCTLQAAVKLDLFTRLGDEARTAADLARALEADARALGMLLRALVAMGLLAREGDRFRCTLPARTFLSSASEQYLGHIINHHRHLMEAWNRLDEAVRSGRPVRTRASQDFEAFVESFQMGMLNIATQLAPQIVESVDLTGRRRFLDLGGGPGTYAVHFCRRSPALRATIFDLATSREFAERNVRRNGLADRITFAEGDFLQDPIPGGNDVVWLSQVLHGEGPEGCRVLLEKAVASLEPRGMILVHEFLLDDSLDAPLFPTLFSLNMLLNTGRGQAYSDAQVREMLEGAGARDVRRLSFRGPSDSGILSGVA